MRSFRRFGPLALVLLVLAVSVKATIDEKISESAPLDELEDFESDYEGYEDGEVDFSPNYEHSSHSYHQPSYPPPAHHSNHIPPPAHHPAPPNYSAPIVKPEYYAEPLAYHSNHIPPQVYHPAPSNYSVPIVKPEYYPEPPVYSEYQIESPQAYPVPVPVPVPAPVPVPVPVPLPVPLPVYPSAVQQPIVSQTSYQGVQQQSNYSTQSYATVQTTQSYAQPAANYSVPQTAVNYAPAAPQVFSNPPAQTYQAKQAVYAPVQANYSAPPVVQPLVKPVYVAPAQVGNYSALPQQQIPSYSIAGLVPFVPIIGHRHSNHWPLYYYHSSPYRTCPKTPYGPHGPGIKDIEAAFGYAQQQLALSRGANIQFMNSSQPSWAARHHVFSFLNQQSARMDEDGLLIELVSQFLSERACMSKWDKLRYLPELTKLVGANNYPGTHSCAQYYRNNQQQYQHGNHQCAQSKYRTFDGFCNNPWHPYWGKSNVCHIRLLTPDYADGISYPRTSHNPRFQLPNPRLVSNIIHNDIPLDGPYNMMKMQWGQFINHDITNTALSSYDGLIDCCKNPKVRGCWPIEIPPGDYFYGAHNITCLNFIRSGVCPICQLGPRQQFNKNTAFLDASHVYGNNQEQANQLRTFQGGLLRFSLGKNNEVLLPTASGPAQEQCSGVCFLAGDNRVNQHPALTALHTLLLRNHNYHANALRVRHPNWNDEILFQEARRINVAEFQMITYNEYLPIVFGPILSAYYRLIPQQSGHTYYEPKADPSTWNEYSTATCRFGHSQIQATFGLYSRIFGYNQHHLNHGPNKQPSFRLKDWFMRPSLLTDGLLPQIINGLVAAPSQAVDPWITNDVRNHLYQSHKEHAGGDLAATNIWRGRDHGIPGYVQYVEYCFNYKVRSWKDLNLFIPVQTLNQLRKVYRIVENIDLFTGGMSERHFPGADTGPTFACVNGIQYYHLKFGDRFYFEHGGQVGSFTPPQLDEIRRTNLARLLCRTAYLPNVPQYAFLAPSNYNPLVNCSHVAEIDYRKF